jgi:hypothetical protein
MSSGVKLKFAALFIGPDGEVRGWGMEASGRQ